jgi:hypothetical protein
MQVFCTQNNGGNIIAKRVERRESPILCSRFSYISFSMTIMVKIPSISGLFPSVFSFSSKISLIDFSSMKKVFGFFQEWRNATDVPLLK